MPAFKVTLQMCLICLAFYTTQYWFFAVPFLALFSFTILTSQIESWLVWTVAAGLLSFSAVQLFLVEGNHLFLYLYIVLAVMLALHAEEPEQSLRSNARFIIALSFGVATLWKGLTPSFVDGSFFEYMLLSETRISHLSTQLTSLTQADLDQNNALLVDLVSHSALDHVTMTSSIGIARLAQLLTWAVLAVEAAIAVSFFILPPRFRHVCLIAFLSSAYLVVSVPSFGMAYAALGHAQADTRVLRNIYLGLFIAMPLTQLQYYL